MRFSASRPPRFLATFALLVLAPAALLAWDYQGHRTVAHLALAGLPSDFPEFVRGSEASERIAYLSGEPDRWRNVRDAALRDANFIDHFLDFEQLPAAGLTAEQLTGVRQAFARDFVAGSTTHAVNFPGGKTPTNPDGSPAFPGFILWAIAENYAQLKSSFATLRAFEDAGGTPTEIANARANILYVMGVMSHYVGDCAQPLHTTDHYNGWTGANPQGFTTWRGFHSWIDGGYLIQAGVRLDDVVSRARRAQLITAPAAAATETAPSSSTSTATSRQDPPEPVFPAIVRYFLTQHAQVVPLYQLERDGALLADGTPAGAAATPFLEEQLLRGGEFLSSLWLTAYRTAPQDHYLRTQLALRAAGQPPKVTPPPPRSPAPTAP